MNCKRYDFGSRPGNRLSRGFSQFTPVNPDECQNTALLPRRIVQLRLLRVWSRSTMHEALLNIVRINPKGLNITCRFSIWLWPSTLVRLVYFITPRDTRKLHMYFTGIFKKLAIANFFIIKPTRCTNFTNLFWHETLHVLDSSSVHHQEFIHCTLGNGICHTGL
jgi:hypothetical protein